MGQIGPMCFTSFSLKYQIMLTDRNDVTNRSFAQIPMQNLMKRVSLPLLGVLVLGFLLIGETQSPVPTRAPAREIASVGLYKNVFSDWSNIPKLCKDDFPLTEFQKTECDSYWRNVLSRAILALIPFLVTIALFKIWSQIVTRTYQRAASRVSKRKVAAVGQVTSQAPQDFYSWLHGFKAVRIKSGEKELTVYLETIAETGSILHLYEAGRWFRREQWVGVKLP
jgi:hypothetical protein